MADLACNIRLEPTRKDLVNDAIAVVRIVGFLPIVITFAVPVEDVQGCNEELMCVLLLITRQVPGVRPHQVQQLVWNVWGAVP